jgi:hypothetical protein
MALTIDAVAFGSSPSGTTNRTRPRPDMSSTSSTRVRVRLGNQTVADSTVVADTT